MRQNVVKKISKITTQKRPGRYNIYLDDQYAFPVSEAVLIKYQLAKGTELTAHQISDIQAADQVAKLRAKALDFIAYRPRTVAELQTKLQTLTDDEDSIETVVADLRSLDLLNDKTYTVSYLQQVVAMQEKGPLAADRYLDHKGIPFELRTTALTAIYPATVEQTIAKRLAHKLFDHYQNYPYNKSIEKVKMGLVRRGFSYSTASDAVASLPKASNAEREQELLVKETTKLRHRYRHLVGFDQQQKK